jgi:hypothetical protein
MMRGAAARTPPRFRHLRWVLPIAAVALLSFGATARAATVTVGSPLTQNFEPGPFNALATAANSTLPEPGANVTSPISGTIVRWRVLGASGGPFRLRVLRPAGGTSFTGVGTSGPETPASPGLQTFTANLPIQAGDTIGIDNGNSEGDMLGLASVVPGAQFLAWAPPLPEGSTVAATETADESELAFNADVETAPPPATAAPAATVVPVIRCIVPKLKGRRLRPAKRVLRRRHCRIGKVIRKHRKKAPRKARIIKQRPGPRTIRPAGSKVHVTLRVRKKAQRKKAR